MLCLRVASLCSPEAERPTWALPSRASFARPLPQVCSAPARPASPPPQRAERMRWLHSAESRADAADGSGPLSPWCGFAPESGWAGERGGDGGWRKGEEEGEAGQWWVGGGQECSGAWQKACMQLGKGGGGGVGREMRQASTEDDLLSLTPPSLPAVLPSHPSSPPPFLSRPVLSRPVRCSPTASPCSPNPLPALLFPSLPSPSRNSFT